ncbi:MAG: VWA-like domain-containing protein [Micrococcaceae bacterium]
MANIRAMNEEELDIFTRALIQANHWLPSFRDALAVLSPYTDETAHTAYVDQYCRMGLSPWFFHDISETERATILLHESMHVLNSHKERGDMLGANADLRNVVGDLEINSVLDSMPEANIESGIVPGKTEPFEKFPKSKTMEQYMSLMVQEGLAQEVTLAPESTSCDESTEDREEAADTAGIEKMSETEKSIARKNTEANLKEALASGVGTGSQREFLENVLDNINRFAKTDWRQVLRNIVSGGVVNNKRGTSHYSFNRTNRRYSIGNIVMPSMVSKDYNVMVGVDTSGSMGNPDFERTLLEVEDLLRNVLRKPKDGVKIFSVDTEIHNIKPVKSVKDLDLQGGGGTDMSVAVDYANSLKKKKPDLLVICTDGFTGADSLMSSLQEYKKPCAILVSQKEGYEYLNESPVREYATLLDVSQD